MVNSRPLGSLYVEFSNYSCFVPQRFVFSLNIKSCFPDKHC
ncbi:hypothetical protein E2C01_081293 [Portunus trituberculatus]|uniref:Uncharacterized protein n=1 Tax=Portunus trituberculatus TaxID=210409 RepID=A0A5B7J1X1_PORTR|nr:hypothetical protein [Portunus trituberculatus]